MPYIKPVERFKWAHWLSLMPTVQSQGELAYVLHKLVLPEVNYMRLSHARAVLKDLYDDITERMKAYERQKREENGDVV